MVNLLKMDHRILIYIPAVCLFFLFSTYCDKIKFKGYKVLRLQVPSLKELKVLKDLQNNSSLALDFWTEPAYNSTVDVCVPPSSLHRVYSKLRQARIKYNIQINNIQSLIDKEEQISDEWQTHRRHKRSVYNLDPGSGDGDPAIDPELSPQTLDPELFYWFNVIGQYASTKEIYEWMKFATYRRPDLVSLDVVGYSYEKRPIKLMKIGLPRKDGQEKPVIWIDSGIHAREWVTIATVTYIIYQLVDGYGKHPEVTRMLHTYDWYLLPIHNPDGYEYSRDYNRMWRKNRAPTFDYKCTGIDLNRNYGFMWQRCREAPNSKYCIKENPCAAVYGGPEPFSEPESRAVSNYILRHRSRIKMFFSLHSYSQLWLMPWGYTRKQPKDVRELERVANAGCAALEDIYGTKYVVGSPARVLYYVGGASLDWAKAIARVKYSYTLELRDRGQYGFLLPQGLIEPTANETFHGLLRAISSAKIPHSKLSAT